MTNEKLYALRPSHEDSIFSQADQNCLERLYYFDMANYEWIKCGKNDLFASDYYVLENYPNPNSPNHTCTRIYNLKTCERSANIARGINTPESGLLSDFLYTGGYSDLYLAEGKWYRTQAYAIGGYIDVQDLEPISIQQNSSGLLYTVDEKYYAFIDDYGIFLRTFEKGEAEEEQIMLFER